MSKKTENPNTTKAEPADNPLEELLAGGHLELKAKTFRGRFWAFLKLNFFAGLVVLAPLVVTLWLFKTIVISVDNALLGFVPERYHLNNLLFEHFEIILPFDPHGLGLLVGVLFLVLVGLAVRNIFGRTLLHWGERLLGRIPGVSSIYNALKQITETVTSTNSKS